MQLVIEHLMELLETETSVRVQYRAYDRPNILVNADVYAVDCLGLAHASPSGHFFIRFQDIKDIFVFTDEEQEEQETYMIDKIMEEADQNQVHDFVRFLTKHGQSFDCYMDMAREYEVNGGAINHLPEYWVANLCWLSEEPGQAFWNELDEEWVKKCREEVKAQPMHQRVNQDFAFGKKVEKAPYTQKEEDTAMDRIMADIADVVDIEDIKEATPEEVADSVEPLITLEMFKKFLADNGTSYGKWEEYIIKDKNKYDLVVDFFTWVDTPEGYNFWSELDHKWKAHIAKCKEIDAAMKEALPDNITASMFKEFLVNNGTSYDTWLQYAVGDNEWKQQNSQQQSLMHFIRWGKTAEGYQFWRDLSSKWSRFLFSMNPSKR